jgi:4-hydroxybutyrate CoA-transferase
MDWESIYKSRQVSLEEAVKQVNSGDRVVMGAACSTPEALIDTLLERSGELRDVEVVAMVAAGKSAYAQSGYENAFRHNSFFVAASTFQAVEDDRADFTPCFFGEFPRIMNEGLLPVDVAMVTVSPPDKVGNVSLGIGVAYNMAAVKNAKTVIAEVSSFMPRTMGYSYVHVSEIDYFVVTDRPPVEAPRPPITDVEEQIAKNVAKLIQDGDCLQLGYGGLPDAILSLIEGKHDLGIHTEMVSDGVMEMVEKGVITCRKKNFHPGKIVNTFAMGSPRLYEWLDDNSMIESYPVDYINDPYVIGQNDNMVSVNSALSVDLLGQAASDMLKTSQFGGVGGQVDFIRGCRLSKNGRSILAFPSTTKDGKYSRIVAALETGQAVTTSRQDVDYIVTENGIANLRGKTVKQRAKALIDIAAPTFRQELTEQFEKLYKKSLSL